MSERSSQVTAYIDGLPERRQEPFTVLFDQIQHNIDPSFVQEPSYGMPGWVVPHSLYPGGYHCDPSLPVPFMSIGNQKGHIGVYHMGIYADETARDWFEEAYAATGFKLNMGAACIRFTAMSKIPYDLIGELAGRISLASFMARYTKVDPRNDR